MEVEVVKETRFAVVMYGGVSLAVYINGVAQELLRMVRSTATEEDGDDFRIPVESLSDVEKLYRDISLLVADRSLIRDSLLINRYCDWLRKGRRGASPLATKLTDRATRDKIKATRFVVDIISGTSAGGINGVYLAKALVAGQGLDALDDLWCTEGSFAKLLNDAQSISDEDGDKRLALGLAEQDPPRSLLNSERMYLKLLTAFEAMDDRADPENTTSFVDEIDLFITLTDYFGIPVPLRLFDQLIYERRHRQNLHFRFRRTDKLNDFIGKFYPFLAFAARATSAFPLAFEPMRIESANSIINQVRNAERMSSKKSLPNHTISEDIWKDTFKPATVKLEEGEVTIDWNKRVFVDGGYLDNKPFGYAIEALAQKQSDVLVDRKLIYVEPQPDRDDGRGRIQDLKCPGVVDNTIAALTSMPRYETIREDLQEVLERNDLIVRINQLVTDARKDELDSLQLSMRGLDAIVRRHQGNIKGLIEKYGDGTPECAKDTVKWDNLELKEVAQQKGPIAYPYYRLRVAALTDSLAKMVTHRAGYDEESDYYLAVRDLVFAWRRRHFSRGEEIDHDIEDTKPPSQTPMRFLRDYDYDYRLRRLRFVLQQADRLLQFDPSLQKELSKTRDLAVEVRGNAKVFSAEEKSALLTEFALVHSEIFDVPATTPIEVILKYRDDEALWKTVRSFKKSINQILVELRTELRQVQPLAEVDPKNPNEARIEMLNALVGEAAERIGAKLNFLLGVRDSMGARIQPDSRNNSAARQRRAQRFLNTNRAILDLLNKIGDELCSIYNGPGKNLSIFSKTRSRVIELFYGNVADSEEQTLVRDRVAEVDEELFLAVRAYLLHFYENFDAYDQIVFPITYKTPIGEGAVIDVARISPLDSTNLIDERDQVRLEAKEANDDRLEPNEKHKAKCKLAGGVFLSFGAFFAQTWRRNDTLWGRLDAVERLVSIILNDNLLTDAGVADSDALKESLSDLRKAITTEMQECILQETEWVKELRNESSNRNGKKPAASLVEFIRSGEPLIDRHALPKKKVYLTAARSATILDKVIQPSEVGRLEIVKDFVLGTFGLIMKARAGYVERALFVRRFLKKLWLFLAAIYLLGVLSVAWAVGFGLYYQSSRVFILVLGITLVVYLVVFSFLWKRVKRALQKVLYAKVTGSDR
jgi:patatin-related protein